MTQLERVQYCIELGYTYNRETGDILNPKGKIVTSKQNGYIRLSFYHNNSRFRVFGHKLAYYLIHNEVPVIIDHINGIKDDNRDVNLRSVTVQENQWNQHSAKGYSWHKASQKWRATVTVDGESKHLGSFNTEKEALECYKKAKLIHHIIN